MASIHYQIVEIKNLLSKVFKALSKYFTNQELVSIEVWANVLFLKFRKGRPTFFSKTKAAELVEVKVSAIKNLPIGFKHAETKTTTDIMSAAITPPVEIQNAILSVINQESNQNDRRYRKRTCSLSRTRKTARKS